MQFSKPPLSISDQVNLLRQSIQVENINKQTKASTIDIDFYKRKRKFTTRKFELKKRTRTITGFDAFRNNLELRSIYLITPDISANGEPANDYIPTMKERPNRFPYCPKNIEWDCSDRAFTGFVSQN